jgi:hypothetical protein
MVMTNVFGVKARRATLDGNFAHKPGLNEIAQIVVSGGPRAAWIESVNGFEDFGRGGMAVMRQKKGHHGKALGRTAQPAALEGLSDLLGVHPEYLEYV